MRGEFAAIARSRVAVAHLPLISQRAGPLTASPPGEAFPAYKKQTPFLCSVCRFCGLLPCRQRKHEPAPFALLTRRGSGRLERLMKSYRYAVPSPLPRVFMPRSGPPYRNAQTQKAGLPGAMPAPVFSMRTSTMLPCFSAAKLMAPPAGVNLMALSTMLYTT